MAASAQLFQARFWGVRGGIPTPNRNTLRFGGNTPCLEVRCGNHLLIFDAGTGIRQLGIALSKDGALDADIFFSRSRFDHVCGLPFFMVGYNPANSFKVWAGRDKGGDGIEEVLTKLMTSPLFPIPLSFIGGLKAWGDFEPGAVLEPRDGIKIRTAALNHPNGATGYRIEFDGRALCYISNTAHTPGKPDKKIIALMKDADVVIYDSFYSDEEFKSHSDLGHSTWQEGQRLCKAAGAKRLVAFQHNPEHDDQTLEAVQQSLDADGTGSIVAFEGLVVDV